MMIGLAFEDGGRDGEGGKSGRRKGSSMMRALTLLETIAARGTPATPTQLNEALDLPKPTIHRLCATLEEFGFLQKSLDGRGLTVGPRLRAIAQNALLSSEQLFLIRAILEKISDTVGETANITVPDFNRMRYLDRVETQWPLRLQLPVGSQVPLHCTASGKLYLSSLPRAARTVFRMTSGRTSSGGGTQAPRSSRRSSLENILTMGSLSPASICTLWTISI